MSDPDAAEAIERRRCADCGRRAPEGRWRCDDCQANASTRTARMVDLLRAARREASRDRHDPEG